MGTHQIDETALGYLDDARGMTEAERPQLLGLQAQQQAAAQQGLQGRRLGSEARLGAQRGLSGQILRADLGKGLGVRWVDPDPWNGQPYVPRVSWFRRHAEDFLVAAALVFVVVVPLVLSGTVVLKEIW